LKRTKSQGVEKAVSPTIVKGKTAKKLVGETCRNRNGRGRIYSIPPLPSTKKSV